MAHGPPIPRGGFFLIAMRCAESPLTSPVDTRESEIGRDSVRGLLASCSASGIWNAYMAVVYASRAAAVLPTGRR
jgi:hypothetical protein